MKRYRNYTIYPIKKRFEESKTDYFKYIGLLTFILSLISFIATFYYNEKWKRAEYFDKKYKDFSSDVDTKLIRQILFYNSSIVRISGRTFELKSSQVNEIILPDTSYYALDSHKISDSTRSILREKFHNYLDNLSSFFTYYDEGNVKREQLLHYLSYDLKAISDTNFHFNNNITKYWLWLFIKEYEYNGIIKMCELNDLPIIPSSKAEILNAIKEKELREFPDYPI
ncbi:MAG: hypothetical protein IPP56_14585 [Bacteroidetes bacterium]|nr:hypothetical protein [Bacteroidota bacterium]MBK9672774.1 hypothetical protein [Bacteroidota bacterium]MBK9800888.1 hypothetical protein [Bacteroidota bacterium]MBP6412033.1 hypothetical protein [Bacteroidia bacterium]